MSSGKLQSITHRREYLLLRNKNYSREVIFPNYTLHCIQILTQFCRVMQILSKILQIGSPPNKSSENYHPLIFNTDITSDFFVELFCRTMWLLSKTRKEMKAQVTEDFGKVCISFDANIFSN